MPGMGVRLTAEKAALRIEQLRRVFEQGYMERDLFERLKRDVEALVEPKRRRV
jgi:hypothetical protein